MAKSGKPEESAEAPAKSGGGMIGMIVVGVAAVASSFGVSYAFGGTSAAPATECDAAMMEKAAYVEPKPDKSNQVHIEMPEILITIGSSPAERYLKMNVSVATSKDSSKMVKDNKAVLIDAFVGYLRSIEVADFEDPRFFSIMRDQLSHRSELVLGAPNSDGVLITEFLLR